MRFNERQTEAIEAIAEGDGNVFLTGGGGTGKSVVVGEAVRRLRDRGMKVVVCAPTGVAAQNVHGSTIHRAFRFPIGPIVADRLDEVRPTQVVRKADVVLIDEIGMVRRDTMDAIARVVDRENSGRRGGRGPLRLVVGDFFQLPPVVSGRDEPALRDQYGEDADGGFYAFQADGWKDMGFHACVLDETMRQKDPGFTAALNQARRGDDACLPFLNRLASRRPPRDAVRLVASNRSAEKVNDDRLKGLKGRTRTLEGATTGSFRPSDMAVPERLKLKRGARVMIVANDPDGRYVNGSTGVVERFGARTDDGGEAIEVSLDDGDTVAVPRNQWENIEYRVEHGRLVEEVIGTFSQFPLKPAWAITFHKSQGQTLEKAVVDPRTFADGQLYVGLSRVRSADGLSLTRRVTPDDLRVSHAVIDFYRSLGRPAPAAKPEPDAKATKRKPGRPARPETETTASRPADHDAADGTELSATSFKVPRSFREDAKQWAWSHGMNLAQLAAFGIEEYMAADTTPRRTPMPGPYASSTVKLPIELKSRAKAYATLHRTTLSQVLTEGMELFMERRKDDGKPGNTGLEAEEQENERL